MSEENHRGRSRVHKDRQVCRQVADAVGWFLADIDDPVLTQLLVVQVDPAPSAARVLITLVPGADEVDVEVVLTRLRDRADELREEVAAEVHRKRAPELTFRIASRRDWSGTV